MLRTYFNSLVLNFWLRDNLKLLETGVKINVTNEVKNLLKKCCKRNFSKLLKNLCSK